MLKNVKLIQKKRIYTFIIFSQKIITKEFDFIKHLCYNNVISDLNVL